MFKKLRKHMSEYWELHLMTLPGVISLLLFSYWPKYGVVVAFQSYNARKGIFGSEWVGLRNFSYLFATSDFALIIRNTILYNVIMIIVNTCAALILAMILSEVRSKRFAKYIQTIYMMPSFLSMTAISMIVYTFLSHKYGMINHIIETLGGEGVKWYMNKPFWPGFLIFMSAWKSIGMSSIIYLAFITGIDPGFYEAAMLDGANRFQQAIYITIPNLRMILTINLISSISGLLSSDFGLFYSVPRNSGALTSVTEVLDIYIFQALKGQSDFGKASASGLFKEVIGLILMLISNGLVRKVTPEYALF